MSEKHRKTTLEALDVEHVFTNVEELVEKRTPLNAKRKKETSIIKRILVSPFYLEKVGKTSLIMEIILDTRNCMM